MPPPPRMHKPYASIILKIIINSKNDFVIWKMFEELVEMNSLIYNTLHFDQNSRLATRLNIFQFSANNSKTN